MAFLVTFTVCVEDQPSAVDAVREAALTVLRGSSEELVRVASARLVSDSTLPLAQRGPTNHRLTEATRSLTEATRSLTEPPPATFKRPLWWPCAVTFPRPVD